MPNQFRIFGIYMAMIAQIELRSKHVRPTYLMSTSSAKTYKNTTMMSITFIYIYILYAYLLDLAMARMSMDETGQSRLSSGRGQRYQSPEDHLQHTISTLAQWTIPELTYPSAPEGRVTKVLPAYQQRLSGLIGPYRGTYRMMAYRVLQPLLVCPTRSHKLDTFGFRSGPALAGYHDAHAYQMQTQYTNGYKILSSLCLAIRRTILILISRPFRRCIPNPPGRTGLSFHSLKGNHSRGT